MKQDAEKIEQALKRLLFNQRVGGTDLLQKETLRKAKKSTHPEYLFNYKQSHVKNYSE